MATQLLYKTGFFVCIILVLLTMFTIFKDGSKFTFQKIVGGSETHQDYYEDLFYRLISRNSSFNSTILDKVIARLFIWPKSTLSSMNTTDIKKFLDQKVNTSDQNKVNTLFFYLFLQNTGFPLLSPDLLKLEENSLHSVMIKYRENICNVSKKVIMFGKIYIEKLFFK